MGNNRELARLSRAEAALAGAALLAVGAALPQLWAAVLARLKPGGRFSGLNSDTAGARTQKELPVGKHALQLYSLGTPNGQKVTCALEELGLSYDAFPINILEADQFTSGFVAINPNSKIPALVDRAGPGGQDVRVFESGSILLYLAEKTGKLLPKDPALRTEALNWLFMSIGAAPFFGQFGHFTVPYAVSRYSMESKRLLSVLDQRLAGRNFLVGEELTIADLGWMPWVQCLSVFYKADDTLGLASYKEVQRWKAALLERPAIAKGMQINGFSAPPELKEYHSP